MSCICYDMVEAQPESVSKRLCNSPALIHFDRGVM